jgi:hypothetical protein
VPRSRRELPRSITTGRPSNFAGAKVSVVKAAHNIVVVPAELRPPAEHQSASHRRALRLLRYGMKNVSVCSILLIITKDVSHLAAALGGGVASTQTKPKPNLR